MQKTISLLKQRIQEELPHSDIRKEGLAPELMNFIIKAESKQAALFKQRPPRVCAVMMAMYEDKDAIYLPMMLRPDDGHVHSGQISFPGGGREEQDEDLIATAIRETEEELGFSVKRENVIGALTDIYIPPSNSLVTPILAYLTEKPTYNIDTKEVAKALDIPLEALQNKKNHSGKKVILTNGEYITMPSFLVESYNIWGGTARMLMEFIKMLKTNDIHTV